jgi:hypothetical protein
MHLYFVLYAIHVVVIFIQIIILYFLINVRKKHNIVGGFI